MTVGASRIRKRYGNTSRNCQCPLPAMKGGRSGCKIEIRTDHVEIIIFLTLILRQGPQGTSYIAARLIHFFILIFYPQKLRHPARVPTDYNVRHSQSARDRSSLHTESTDEMAKRLVEAWWDERLLREPF